MPTKIVSTNIAGNVKPCFASSPIAGLTVRCNGEEKTKVLDMNGNMVDAQFPAPTVPPVLLQTTTISDQTFSDGQTPGQEVTVNDGVVTINTDLVQSATAGFVAEDVGHRIDVGILLDNLIVAVNSPTEVKVNRTWPAGATAVIIKIYGRPAKIVRSATAQFVAADVGRNITVGAINDVIASVTSPTEILVTTNDLASLTAQNFTIHDRPVVLDKWVGYAYVWAATQRYPMVENDVAIGGSLAPRGMPSPVATVQVDMENYDVRVTVAVPPAGRTDLDQAWIFRTYDFATQAEALSNAEAGNMYFVAAVDVVAGGAAVVYQDDNSLGGLDQIEIDNFGVPIFQFCIYVDPYWWGWGNYPLSVQGSWTTGGVLTLTDGTKWFDGRNGQYVRLENIQTGGIGNNGLWLFKWLTATTAQITNLDGTNATLAAAGTGGIVVQGPPTTLFRSKMRNPFSWGWTEILATGARIPQIYAFKVGGGLGTAIGQIPNLPYLLLSTEYPAGTFTLDLRSAGITGASGFERTLRQISNFYSITSHFSQFPATKSDDSVVLWGWDAKNYCIVATDGMSIHPVSQPVAKTLRQMSPIRSRQIVAHGAYDAKNRLNCLWLPSQNAGAQVNMLFAQHAPTGQWFVHDDMDVLCSAQFQDGDSNLSKIYVGTETGFMGEAFAEGFYSNWISSGRSSGPVGFATATTISRGDGSAFYLDRDGYVGNWCLITDANGATEQWGRISAVTASQLTFDYIRPAVGGLTNAFNPIPVEGFLFFVGVIECRALKYFDYSQPAEDKKLSEIHLTLDGVYNPKMTGHIGSTFLRYYRERTVEPLSPNEDGKTAIKLERVHFDDGDLTQSWFTQIPPTERIKTFGIEVIDRGYGQWRFYNWTLKAK